MDNNSYLYSVNTTSFKDSELNCLKSGIFFFETDIILRSLQLGHKADITNTDDNPCVFNMGFLHASLLL